MPASLERLSDVAYARILDALFSRRLAPGATVTQSELGQIIEVPTGPIRDALRTLEADGILVVHPRSGIQLIGPSVDLSRSTYQFRTIIEAPATRAFSQTASDATIAALIAEQRDLMESAEARLEAGTLFDDVAASERRFHTAIVSSLANPIVAASYRRLSILSRIVRMDGPMMPHIVDVLAREHLDVLGACRARDRDAAEEAMVRHLTNALHRNLGLA